MKRKVWIGGLFFAGVLFFSASASAETLTSLWAEDFNDVSDWTLDSTFQQSFGNTLTFLAGTAQLSQWHGPNYRGVVGSSWNPVANHAINFTIDNLVFHDSGGTAGINRQTAWMFENTGSRSTPDTAGAEDWFEIKVLNANCCAVQAWEVQVKDNGVITVNTDYPIGFNPQGLQIDANVTIDVWVQRYWINWTIGGGSGSSTGTWPSSPDGPFQSSTSVEMSLWGYTNQNQAPWQIQYDYLALAILGPDPPIPPAPITTPGGDAHADFLYAFSTFGVQFRDNSSDQRNLTSWLWDFADGFGSKHENPVHQYPCAGNYTVTLRVQNNLGKKDAVTKHVEVKDSRPTCGYFQRHEGGVIFNTGGGWINVPEAFFIAVFALSLGSVLLGVEVPLLSKRIRTGFVVVSAFLLLFSIGVFSFTF
jgi:PKD repeat protein